VAGRAKFTRIPKVNDLITAGVPAEAIPTYCALADHANNKTGLCWPKMETLATILHRSVRTVQRHLHLLKECGLIEFVNRRRWKGRFSSYTYKILHIVTTGHARQVESRRSNRQRTKPVPTTPKSPLKSVKDDYEWLFGEQAPADGKDSCASDVDHKQKTNAERRTDGYEWLFQRS